MDKKPKYFSGKYGWLLLLFILIIIDCLAVLFHTRVDLTKEKRYTITKSTTDLVKSFDDEVAIDIFLTGNLPAGFQKLSNTTEEFLQILKEHNSQINYHFLSPEDEIEGTDKKYGDTLVALGANPINLTVQIKAGQENKIVFPVALVKYKGKQSLVNLYAGGKRIITPAEMNSAEAMMEYQFAKSFDALVNPAKPLVAYSIGNGEPAGAGTYDLQQILQKEFQLFTINLNVQKFIPDTFKVLMIVKPSLAFTEDEKFKLDQYVMRGGKLICFIDNLHAEQDSLQYKSELVAYDRGLNLTDIFFKYGIRINTDLVMDLQCDFMPFAVGGTAANPQFEPLHWNYYPLFESGSNHTINKNISLVVGRFSNSIDTVQANNITKTILLHSSSNSRTISTPALISLNENRNTPEDVLFKKNHIPTAVLLEGTFSSLYRNRVTTSQNDSLAAYGMAYKNESEAGNKMIVVADGDMVLNDVSPKEGPLPMGFNFFNMGTQYEYQFANREFLMNCLEYLTNKPGIIETRNKDITLRLLDPQKVKEQKTTWQYINIGVPISLVLLFGWLYQLKRKKEYT